MSQIPQRTREYIGPVTDTRIWDKFAPRSGDIILSTPPKCGTTWSQAILMMLIYGAVKEERPVWRDSFWLDCGLADQQEVLKQLDAQAHRRCIKSHTPLDGIPYHPAATYITVYRHPIDVHYSMEKHVANMVSDILDFMYPPQPGAAFDRFLAGSDTSLGTDDLTLAAVLHHFHSFRAWEHLPNIHFFHYADLKRDAQKVITQYAAAADLRCDDALASAIAQASSFSAMKETTRRNKREHSAFKDDALFFDSASSKKWTGRLSTKELNAYRAKIASLAAPADVAWLENGGLRL